MSLTALAFLGSYTTALLASLVRHPVYGLSMYVLMVFLDPGTRWWGANLPGIRWSLIAAIVTMLAYFKDSSRLNPVGTVPFKGIYVAAYVFVALLAIQLPFALLFAEHKGLLILFAKYLVITFLCLKILDSNDAIRIFLWAYIIGSFYFGWIAYADYTGGRFEGFGGVNVGEANAGGLTLAVAVFAAGPLFLTGTLMARIALIAMMPFIVNGIIVTQSRSAFLCLVAGGIVFIAFSPKRLRGRLMLLSALGGVLFLILADDYFWGRMSSLMHAGQADVVVTTDTGNRYETGHGRLVIMEAQWEMFVDHPLGTGHRGTAALSPFYLPDAALTGHGANRARASHNTFFSVLVEQGFIGALIYIYLIWWSIKTVRYLSRHYGQRRDFDAALVPSIAAILCSIAVGDLFVDYLKFEPRIWFMGLALVMAARVDRDAGIRNQSSSQTSRDIAALDAGQR